MCRQQFTNHGTGALKSVTYFDQTIKPQLDHDGVVKVDLMTQHLERLQVPDLKSMFERMGVEVVKTGLSYTSSSGLEGHVCFRGSQETVHEKLVSNRTLVENPADLSAASFPSRASPHIA